jgi:hypothetical protein
MRPVLKFLAVGLAVAVMATPAQGGGDVSQKSMGKALLLSLLVPGMGQQYLGHHKRARVMWVSEAAIWTTYALFKVQGNNREDRYKEMAELFAGVEGVKDDGYYQAIGFYISSYEYNIDVKREGRFRYPYDPDKQDEYFEQNGYFDDDAWEWESLQKQLDYRETRTASRDSDRRATLTTGFAVLNRVVSMIDVYLSLRLSETGRVSSYPRLMMERSGDEGFHVYLSTSF